MNISRTQQVVAAAVGGLAHGALCGWAELVSTPQHTGLVAHVAGITSQLVGSWWGWAALPLMAAAALMCAGSVRSWTRGWLLSATFLGTAVGAHYAMDPLMGGALDHESLLLWLAGTVMVSPVLGLLAHLATRRELLGTAVRVLVPLAMILEVVLVPGANILDSALGWRDLVASVLKIALATLWTIVALAVGGHAVHQPRMTITTAA